MLSFKEEYKINIKYFVIFINDKIYENINYFIPKTLGIYHIKISIKNNIQNCYGLFSKCKNILNIDLSSFDTKNVTNMSYMFNGCKSLKNINLSSFNTKNVTNISYMFNGCESLKNIRLSSFVTEMLLI